ncbi:MAG: Vitamin B12 transporter BtuB [Gemmatimonadaceae bacterium]|nr:Vitamin B12 transporter BtuB [Gemmatimonadaceae bacterium]
MYTTRSPGRHVRFRVRPILASAALLLFGATAQAQNGVIAGTVSDLTGRGLSAVRLQIVGSQTLATGTDDLGRYVLRAVPAGPHVLRATRLGFRPETQNITVRAGDTTRVNITLNESAVELSQVVVTGTGGAVEKRQVGASIGQVDASKLTEQMAVPDVGRLLSSKVTGLRATTVGGGVGTGQDIRIRGTASLSLSQRPAVYVDGVRVDSRATEWFTSGACCSFGGGASTDRLGDLNPSDIERIEVLKGAAAATLYGSEATNGVIQIFTKRGRTGDRPTEWNIGLGTGFQELRHNLQTKEFPRFVGIPAFGGDGTRALDANETMIEKGPYYGIDVSASGGTARSTYYTSSQFSKDVGSIQPNDQVKGSLRLNLTFAPSDKWTIEARSAYVRDRINEIQAGNNWTALLGNAINGNPRSATKKRPYGEAWVPVEDIKTMTTQSDVDRWTGGLTLNYTFRPNLTQRFTVGIDAVNDHKDRFFPYAGQFGPAGVTNGQKNLGLRNYKTYTIDYLLQYNFKLPFSIESNLSAGGQGFWDIESLLYGIGNTFAGPGVNSISSAATTASREEYTKTINMGVLAQNRFSWKDQVFATVGLRVDGNSAFGKNYGYKRYPKVDLSYDMMKGGYLPGFISAARIRAAYGEAGKMPGPFDSFTSYASTPVFASAIGIVPLNPGNADLRPEKSVEKEVGLELGLFDDRLGIEASFYNQKTLDAIVQKQNAPSAGFTQAKRVNIGEIQNLGWEGSINYQVYASARMDWTSGLKLDGNENRIIDLGGVNLGNNFRMPLIRKGQKTVYYPIGGVWDRKPTGFSVKTTGSDPTLGSCTALTYGCPTTTRSDTVVYFGPGLPKYNVSWSNQLRYRSFTLYGLVSMERGAWFGNGDRAYRIRQGGSDEYLSRLGPNGERTFRADSTAQFASILNYIDKRDNVRLREISLAWQVPEGVSNMFRVGRSSVTLSGQNLMWWDDCNCVDPNMNWAGASSFSFNNGFLMQPAPRVFRLQIRTRF